MATNRSVGDDKRAALDVFVGEWTAQVLIPGTPAGRLVCERALGGQYLIQRAETPQPEFPDGIMLIAYDEDTDAYTQHYFDSRGIVRLYKMNLRDGVWTLQRDAPDFSSLDSWQRFEGIFSDDGDRIDARWETSHDSGEHWEFDFGLTYTRVK